MASDPGPRAHALGYRKAALSGSRWVAGAYATAALRRCASMSLRIGP